MQKELESLFIYETDQVLKKRYEFKIIQMNLFNHDEYDIFIRFSCHHYFYDKKNGNIYRGCYSMYHESNPKFPTKIRSTDPMCALKKDFEDEWENPKIGDEIVFIYNGYIFFAIVMNTVGYTKSLIIMNNKDENGFLNKLIKFADKLIKEKKIKDDDIEELQQSPKKDSDLQLVITPIEETNEFGSQIKAYKVINDIIPVLGIELDINSDCKFIKVVRLSSTTSVIAILPIVDKCFEISLVGLQYFWILDENLMTTTIKKITFKNKNC